MTDLSTNELFILEALAQIAEDCGIAFDDAMQDFAADAELQALVASHAVRIKQGVMSELAA